MEDAGTPAEGRPERSEVPGPEIAAWVNRWREKGLIGGETAEALLDDLGSAEAPSEVGGSGRLASRVFSPAMALVAVGGILVVGAVVLIAAQLWDELAPAGRFSTVGVPTLLLYGIASYLRATNRTARWFADGLALIGACLVPFAIWLALGMTRDMPDPGSSEATGWLALATGLGLIVQLATAASYRGPALTLPPSCSLIWLTVTLPPALMAPKTSHATSWALTVAGLVLMGVGQVLTASRRHGHALAPHLLGAVAALFGVTVLAAEHEGGVYAAAIGAPLALVLAASHPLMRIYLWPAAVFLVINIFHVGFAHFQESAGLPITLLGCGLASLAAGYVVHRVRKEYAADP
jgi:hypothetical protein